MGGLPVNVFEETFGQLRAIMLAAAPSDHDVERDRPGDLQVRTTSLDPRTKKPGWFGTVAIKKSYVAYHLVELYYRPDLGADISPALAKRRQGKACFNFKAPDASLFAELAALSERCHRLD